MSVLRRVLFLRPKCKSWSTSRPLCTSTVRSIQDVNILDTLSSRSLLAQVTAPNSLRRHLDGREQRSIYVGLDPTADSLHVGNLLPLVAALHFVQHGHRIVVLIGGATGSIGDPSGRDTERSVLSTSELDRNVAKITEQVRDFFQKAGKLLSRRMIETRAEHSLNKAERSSDVESTPMQEAAETSDIKESEVASEVAMDKVFRTPQSQPSFDITVVNNQEWYQNMNVLTFLRDVGKLARVGTMLARDSVKSRMQTSPSEIAGSSPQTPVGLSFTEFSYQLLQAYDFSVLHQAPWHCTVQLGGSDQMGNIMAGVDFIRRQKARLDDIEEGEDSENTAAYGLTLPLLTTASGAKFGKSAGNAVWLSSEKCSDYDFYQFFYRSRDDEVELYLKTLTLLSMEMIDSVIRAQKDDPPARRAQTILARQVTELVRGKEAVQRAEAATRVLFETNLQGLQLKDVIEAFKGDVRLQELEVDRCVGLDLKDLSVNIGLTNTKSEGKRAIINGGFYINNVAVKDANRILQRSDLVCDGKLVVLRKGKTEHRIIHVKA